MAVSNTIGSNVFDILVGLGIPWGLQTMVVNYGSTVSSSHFLSEMTPDACALPGASVVLALQLRAAGEALPHLLRRLATALCKGVQSSLGVPARGSSCLLELTGASAVNTHLWLPEEGKDKPSAVGS